MSMKLPLVWPRFWLQLAADIDIANQFGGLMSGDLVVSGVASRNSSMSDIKNCEGVFKPAGTRNGKTCFTNVGGTGALYFDGKHWKLCRAGQGPSETGWNFSQLPSGS